MSNLDLYLPQLCYLVLIKENKDAVHVLQKFILEISMKNANIGFRALHYFYSWSEDKNLGAEYWEQAMDFYNLLEGALVNQELPKHYQKTRSNTERKEVKDLSEYIDKKYKADYISL